MAKKRLFDENGNEVKGKIKKPFYKKVWFWVVVIIFVGIFGSMGEDEEAVETDTAAVSDESTVESTESAKEESETEEVVKAYGVGDVVVVGDVEYTLNSVELADTLGNEYLSVTPQGKYLVVNLTVKNNGNEALMVDSSLFTLKDGEKTFEADSEASMYANQDESGNSIGFFLEEMNPDISMDGTIAFDVSEEQANSQSTQLQVSTGFFGTETELINLH